MQRGAVSEETVGKEIPGRREETSLPLPGMALFAPAKQGGSLQQRTRPISVVCAPQSARRKSLIAGAYEGREERTEKEKCSKWPYLVIGKFRDFGQWRNSKPRLLRSDERLSPTEKYGERRACGGSVWKEE